MLNRALAGACSATSLAALATAVATTVVTVSGPSPFRTCHDDPAHVFVDTEVEPSIAVDPRDAQKLAVVYQQDRFADGAARGIVAASSSDGGRTWSRRPLPAGFCANRPFAGLFRTSDPWISIGADGRLYALASSAVTTSADGGRTWSDPFLLATPTRRYTRDKGSLTADPVQPGVAYATWARIILPPSGPPLEGDAMFAETHDGGRSWSAPRAILLHGKDSGPIGSIILVDAPRHLLYHACFWQVGTRPTKSHPWKVLIQSSTDGGRTWSTPTRIGKAETIGLAAKTFGSHRQIRTGFTVPSFAVDRAGKLYAVWQDSRFAHGARDQIVIAGSADRGRTWSVPKLISTATAQGFVPNVAVTPSGTIGVSSYELEPGRKGDSARFVLAISRNGGRSYERQPLGASFDLDRAPMMLSEPELLVPPGLFLGDYMGLAAAVDGFHLAFVTTTSSGAGRTDVQYATVPG